MLPTMVIGLLIWNCKFWFGLPIYNLIYRVINHKPGKSNWRFWVEQQLQLWISLRFSIEQRVQFYIMNLIPAESQLFVYNFQIANILQNATLNLQIQLFWYESRETFIGKMKLSNKMFYGRKKCIIWALKQWISPF